LNKVQKARSFARLKHSHIKRKDGKTPYFVHLEQVVKLLEKSGIRDQDVFCAAWLHDTIEDTNTDYDDIEEQFGRKVANLVGHLTKDKRLPKQERESKYIKQLQKAPFEAKLIKFCDILANIADLKNYPMTRKIRIEHMKTKIEYFAAIQKDLIKNRSKLHVDRMMNALAKF
jgi:guanosine-3',5'-bis(diphosphate) 3'-pyrophosphohydrolase